MKKRAIHGQQLIPAAQEPTAVDGLAASFTGKPAIAVHAEGTEVAVLADEETGQPTGAGT